jgi:AraC family ethanolamine operon transcriptional activator
MVLDIPMGLAAPVAALSGPVPAVWGGAAILQTNSTDVDEHCASLGRWRLNYDQISAGAFRGSFTQLSLPKIEVFREITSQQVRQYGQLGSHSFGIGLPWWTGGEVNCNGASVADAKVITCFDAEIDMCTPKGFELRGIVMSAALIEELAAALNIELPRAIWNQLVVVEMAEPPVAQLRRLLAMVHNAVAGTPQVFDDPAACGALEDSILVAITDMLPTARPFDPGRSAAARRRIVGRTCEMMLAGNDRPVSLLDICKAVGASPRKLSYCFREVLGTSPMQYWRAMRLNHVRRDLKRCDDIRAGVYDIAVRHGFWHFSQFSQDYKRHFSELPSETLRRARLA